MKFRVWFPESLAGIDRKRSMAGSIVGQRLRNFRTMRNPAYSSLMSTMLLRPDIDLARSVCQSTTPNGRKAAYQARLNTLGWLYPGLAEIRLKEIERCGPTRLVSSRNDRSFRRSPLDWRSCKTINGRDILPEHVTPLRAVTRFPETWWHPAECSVQSYRVFAGKLMLKLISGCQ